jgi:beta-lactam-binding protein with PASTA domain
MDLRSIFDNLRKIDLKKLDKLEPRYYRAAIVALTSLVLLMAFSGLVAFFLSLRGEERTLVPNVVEMDLPAALMKLQEKELYPRVSLRFSGDPSTRGTILEQDPQPGTIVKAGRRIALVVSRGAAQDKVGDYVGQTIDAVKLNLQAVFGTTRQLITVREPPDYVYDKNPAGTILGQSPPPNTDVTGPVQLVFVVSRGAEHTKVKVPDLMGLPLAEAISNIEKSGIAFQFSLRPAEGRERPGTIVAQLPASGGFEDPATPVSIVYAAPAPVEGISIGLFSQDLPEYPYPLKVSLILERLAGPPVPLITADHPGKKFTIPYAVPKGSVLVLQVLNKVVARYEVR